MCKEMVQFVGHSGKLIFDTFGLKFTSASLTGIVRFFGFSIAQIYNNKQKQTHFIASR